MVFPATVLTTAIVVENGNRREFMKTYLCLLSVLLVLVNCGRRQTMEQTASPVKTSTPCQETVITKETATLIAKGDAVDNYQLSDYDITVEERPESWRIVFKLKDPGLVGGGPDYLIEKKTGKILKANYYK